MTTRRGGFTLVEVIVGLLVASIAMTAGMLALAGVQDRSAHAEEFSLAVSGGATQRAMLVEWLSGARARAVTGEMFTGMQADEQGRMVDQLLFPTSSPTPLGVTSTVVALYIDDDPDTPERGLVAELTGATFGEEPRRMELVPEAGAMEIRYLGLTQGVPIWEETWDGRNQLPRLVQITLFAAPGEALPPLLQYPIRAAMGGGL
ncbi:MAG TPA: prepilin-type N-terminal cleavage/methylation domain-containing protein [Longimicrobiales bacterium]|nr:prepilin-type N-terminal cleavage/methylation domain-containing protein [Longimicrobiales bacterium]